MGLLHEIIKCTFSILTAAVTIIVGELGTKKLWSYWNRPRLEFVSDDIIEGTMIAKDVWYMQNMM